MSKKSPEQQLKGSLKTLKLNEDTISTILGGIVVIVVGLLIFNYFKSINSTPGSITPEAVTEEANQDPSLELVEENGVIVPKGLPTTYTVKKGDHLWSIAENYYQSGYNWVDIAQANQLNNPSALEEGQELTIPKVEVKQTTKIASSTALEQTKDSAATSSIESESYNVQKGDSLWSISLRAYGDGYQWVKIYEANKSTIGLNPGLIEVNQTLMIPR